jgi:crossover junction endodeoxyribonuclease RuvC
MKERIVLGIDPGTMVMGYGVVFSVGTKMQMLEVGSIKLGKLKDHTLKLQEIFKRTVELIDRHHPDEIAIEAPFYGKNVQSMLKLGRAQGVAMAAAMHRETPITEYAPKKIKMAITGNGNASKEQVARMLVSILSTNKIPNDLDATDGLAAAVCHLFQNNALAGGKRYSGWDAFLQKNPDRKL